MKMHLKLTLITVLISTLWSFHSLATVVQIETASGPIKINLYDESTPLTVANFLEYVEDGDYENVIIHRADDGFVIQGGGFRYNGGSPLNANGLPLDTISSNSAVSNEPVFSNLRGTIAMAKQGGNPNSATNQWFINLSDRNQALDLSNGGFTVFGEVIENGMDIIDSISELPIESFGAPFGELPLEGYDSSATPRPTPTGDNLVIISNISVIDTTVNSAAGLNPTPTTAPPAPEPQSSSGGGSIGWIALVTLGLFRLRKLKSSH